MGYIHNSLRLEVEHAEIAKHDADEILTLAREIVASLDDTKIPDEVAKHIRASVARIIFALEHLNIFGVAGVEDAIAHLLGKSWLHRSEVQEIEKKSPGTLKKLGMMTGKLLTAIKWGVDRAAAIEDGGEIVKRLIDASEEFL
ncbi:MAG: hypothetical protein JSR81_14660 [Proteobacteria bacterium]|nr:hypothetical protein [Pseudomonadota bacterium]